MKRKLTLILIAILTVAMLTGCTGVANSAFAGTYWLPQPTESGVKTIYEKLVYTVSSESESELVPKISSAVTGMTFTVEEGSTFTTELYDENGFYVYKTSLKIGGEYIYDGKGHSVTGDYVETETVFKGMEDKFAPVKTTRRVRSTYPQVAGSVADSNFKTVTYTSTIEYGEKDAVFTVSPDEASKPLFLSAQEPITVKKYNKKAFMDNDLMPLLFRNFKQESTLSYTFSVIEDATGIKREIYARPHVMAVQSTESTADNTAIKPITVKDILFDGVLKTVKFNAFGISFSTTGEYAQSFMYAFYANSIEDDYFGDENSSRHYMVKSFRPSIYDSGYTVYTLKSISHDKD